MEVKADLIRRNEAIAYAISGRVRTLRTGEDDENWIRTEEVRESLLTMPSAEPKHGKWEETVNSHCTCPFCGAEWSFFENETERFNCCPNCGARLDDGEKY